MPHRKSKLLACLSLMIVCMIAACGSDKAGGLVVLVTSDLSIPKDLDRVQVEVTQAGFTLKHEERALGASSFALPAEFRLSKTARSTPVQVTVSGLRLGVVRVTRTAITQIPTKHLAVLRMPLDYLCDQGTVDGSACPDDQTCKLGSCESVEVRGDSLPIYDGPYTAVVRKVDGSVVSRQCFDAASCFSAASRVTVDDVATCSFAFQSATPEQLNVAIQLPVGSAGICGQTQCWVVLDPGAAWTYTDSRVYLPKSLCDGSRVDAASQVVLAQGCEAKNDFAPVCDTSTGATSGGVGTAPVTAPAGAIIVACVGAAVESCGNCGTRRRACVNGDWSDWSDCLSEGFCEPNETRVCSTGEQVCGGDCQWTACAAQECEGPAAQACGNCGTQTRACNASTGQWGPWSNCQNQGECKPDDTQVCSDGVTTIGCGGNCRWDTCPTPTTPVPTTPTTPVPTTPTTPELTCTGDSQQSCGNCGQQTRTCDTATGQWSAWSACNGEGDCLPGATRVCSSDGTQTCAADCAWSTVCQGQTIACTGVPQESCGNCGTRTRSCDTSTGQWSAWSACSDQGACAPGETRACGSDGAETCGMDCAWGGVCEGQTLTCTGMPSEACGNCGTRTRSCDTSTGQWSAWSACSDQGACAPGVTRACMNNGTETCGTDCEWGVCGGQDMPCSGAAEQACGNCGTQTRTCDMKTGEWSAWSTCAEQGTCTPGATRACGSEGTQTCGMDCEWLTECVGQVIQCSGASQETCGNCGTRTRMCDTTTGTWSAWSVCSDQGACAPDATEACGVNNSGTRMCSAECEWGACGAQVCPGVSQQACGNCGTQMRRCNSDTGAWSAWSECTDEGQCDPGSTRACGDNDSGTETCSENCAWSGVCEGEVKPCPAGPTTQACPRCGGTQMRICNTSTGEWGPWSVCGTPGECDAGATGTCGNGGSRTCSESCTWGACTGQMCVGTAPTRGCGNCGTQTALCDASSGQWSTTQWAACTDEGECAPGETEGCEAGGTRTCNGQCAWDACGCPKGQHSCDGVCVDDDSEEHCGTLCSPCQAPEGGSVSCNGSTCVPACDQSPRRPNLCGDQCVYFVNDENNCGECGNVCPAPGGGGVASCVSGKCMMNCDTTAAAGPDLCAGTCTNLLTDAANCGECGNSCTAGRRCQDGRCTPLVTAPPIGGSGGPVRTN